MNSQQLVELKYRERRLVHLVTLLDDAVIAAGTLHLYGVQEAADAISTQVLDLYLEAIKDTRRARED